MPNTIAQNLTRLNNAKEAIAEAIVTKGGELASGAGFEDFADAINSLPSSGSATLISKAITQNGTYNASSDNADGYSSVTVNVPEPTAPFQRYEAVQGGWTGGVGGQVQRYDETEPEYGSIRCCISHWVYIDGSESQTLSSTGSNVMIAIGVLEEATYGSYVYHKKIADTGWQSLPFVISPSSIAGLQITENNPLVMTFRNTSNTEITPEDVGVITIT